MFAPLRSPLGLSVLVLGLAAVLAPTPVDAQRASNIRGVVRDESGVVLPGITITVSGPGGDRVTRTDSDGRYRVLNLDAGTYTLTAMLEGFATFRQEGIVLRLGSNFTVDVALGIVQTEPDRPLIRGAANSGSNRPQPLPQSCVSSGSMVTMFGENIGPEGVTVVSELPLAEELGGASFSFETQAGERLPCRPVFVSPNQSACVAPNGLTPGERADLRATLGGRTSPPHSICVRSDQAGFFTKRQNGLGEAVATFPDFRVVSPQDPAKPGDNVTAWLTDSSRFDREPGVEDKRNQLELFELSLAGFPLETVQYYGSTPGFVGGAQANFQVGDNPLFGCGVPVQLKQERPDEDEPTVSNNVTIPISADGEPCSDPHGFNQDQVRQLMAGENLDILTATISDATRIDGRGPGEPERMDSATYRVGGQSFTETTWNRINPINSCLHTWLPSPRNPFAPAPIDLAGLAALELPWRNLPDVAPGAPVSDPPIPDEALNNEFFDITFGSGSLTGDGVALNFDHSVSFTTDTVKLKRDLVERLADPLADNGPVSIDRAIQAILESGMGREDLFVLQSIGIGAGPRGIHNVTCLVGTSEQEIATYRETLNKSFCHAMEYLMPQQFESIGVTYQVREASASADDPGEGLDAVDVTVLGTLSYISPANELSSTGVFQGCLDR